MIQENTIFDDYVQSSNVVINFMSKLEYLKELLLKKAIIPRYCKENIDYLEIINDGERIKEIAVLQKCFCDIPFHKITETFKIEPIGKNFDKLDDFEKYRFLREKNSHPDFYGNYAIAFSKDWAERKCLQPIQYVNEKSDYVKDLKRTINFVLNENDLPDICVYDIMRRICYIKPVRGLMYRQFKKLKIYIKKNFHDECEWRYVPSNEALSECHKEAFHTNTEYIDTINMSLKNERYEKLWLKFTYDDIRYLIVANSNDRIDLIEYIVGLPDSCFSGNAMLQRYILISKIMVLDEIRKDS